MNNLPFRAFLTSNMDLEKAEIKKLLETCGQQEFAKGQVLLSPGQKCQHTFYVGNGLLRQYSLDNKGKEHVLQFAPEGWFMTDRESSYFGQESIYYIEALEDSRIFLIEEQHIIQLTNNFPGFAEFNNKLLHNHIRHLQQRINSLLSDTAEQRYLKFISTYPDLLLRVPQWMIASYLGITPEGLSRVRREMASRYDH